MTTQPTTRDVVALIECCALAAPKVADRAVARSVDELVYRLRWIPASEMTRRAGIDAALVRGWLVACYGGYRRGYDRPIIPTPNT